MRVAFVSEPWDDVVPGGGGSSVAIVTRQLASRLARRASVLIYSAKRSRRRPDTQHDADGIEYRRIRITPEKYVHRAIVDLEPDFDRGWFSLPYWASPYYFRGYAQRVARELAARSIDIVHVQSFGQFVPIIRKHNPRAKIVLHLHSDQVALLDPACVATYLRNVDLVLAPGNHTVRSFCERHPKFAERFRVLTNGADLVGFSPRTAEPADSPSDVLRCLFVGRISPEKGVHVLLDAFGELQREFPSARLDVYGGKQPIPYNLRVGLDHDPVVHALKEFYGSSRTTRVVSSLIGRRLEYLEALEQRHGELFGRSVFLHGPVPHERLRQVYQDADLFVLPTVCHETCSLVLLEAMASGIPVVATGATDLNDAVTKAGAGFAVERDDPAGLAAAMRELAADPPLRKRMGRNGRDLVAPIFAWDGVAERLVDYYDELMRSS